MTTPITSEVLAFAAARHATDRSALARFIAARGGAAGEVVTATARGEFNATAPLLAPGVASAARSALAAALGPPARDVNWTAWPHVKRTRSGSHFTRSWREFGCWHAQLATQVIEKGESIAYAPVTNVDGHRRNASTASVNLLLLDADGSGDWFDLWNEIVAHDLAALLHRTASHTPAIPKWRVAFPLATPISTSTPRSVLAWRGMYATARTVFGSLARLQGPGFDPATDGPHHPWFPGSRRRPDACTPEVVQRAGATLDLNRLVAALPSPAPRVTRFSSSTRSGAPSLLALAFEAAGLLGPDLGQWRTAVVCPWNLNHTVPLPPDATATSATVLFEGSSGANLGAFHCLHAACGTKSPGEVLAELPADAVEYARAMHRVDSEGTRFRPYGVTRLDVALPRLPRDSW